VVACAEYHRSPVILVENVRTYYDILVRFEAPRRSPIQTGLAMQ
jgi:hypothetical protein